MSGCLFDSDPPRAEFLIFESEYDEIVRIDVTVKRLSETVFDELVELEPEEKRKFRPFEEGEGHTVKLDPKADNIDEGAYDRIHYKPCRGATLFTITYLGEIEGGLGTCGA